MHDQLHSLTRERLLDDAIASGKFGPERRSHYASLYDRDPLVAAATIGALAAATPVAQVVPHVHPVPAAVTEATPEQVQAWTDQLFPEARAARVLEATVQARGPQAYPIRMSDGSDS